MRWIRLASAVWLAIVVVSTTLKADAPFDRYEVGRRLRAFETAWDGQTDDLTTRDGVSQRLQDAVKAFFAGRMPEAGRNVTEAHLVLNDPQRARNLQAVRWAESRCVQPQARLMDATTPELDLVIAAYYPCDLPEGATSVRMTLGAIAGSRVENPLTAEPTTVRLPLRDVPEGDHELVTEFLVDDQIAATNRQTISVVERLEPRLEALKATIGGWPEEATADRLSARAALERLQALARKRTPESDVFAAKVLADLEEQVRCVEAGTAYLKGTRGGVFWVTVPLKTVSNVATRIFVPESAAKGTPIPLVVALHGAGGSENMFFETYGHGSIVDFCKARGWMLVAPRSGFFGSAPLDEMVDELARIYPIDVAKVMLVGHSMGAAQAIGATQTTPSRFAAVAALGGGGAVRARAGLDTIPFFVGVGKDDFARTGARRLAESLRQAKVKTVDHREYDHIEHLGIVQVALDDVFRFFDAR